MEINSLQELYLEQLKDLYDAEHQIIKALPKMIDKTESEELKDALNEHLEVTREQASRIERIFSEMGEKAKAEKCKGMQGVIAEGDDLIGEIDDPKVRDAAIIAAAQRVEHYEMAGYGTARTYAQLLGEEEAADLLQETLDEEKEADQKLTELASELNVEAEEGGEEEAAQESRTAKSGRTARSTSSSSTSRRKKRVA
ncbi:MAG TPA: ferritin-like domain-containing protein [Terriglobales bacterium]